MELSQVTCPTCFETFEIVIPETDSGFIEVDYDCEICCRPMVITCSEEGILARSLEDL